MKKANLVFLFFCVSLGVFAQSGVLQEKSGTVEIKLPKSESFVTANIGDQLSQDTVISTGFRSFAVIEIGSASITVRPLTRLTLTEIQASNEAETLNVNLQSGRVRVDVKPPAGTKALMSINSPSAVASVRGTSFEFDIYNLYVSDGTVSFMGNQGQEIMVSAGSGSRVETNARARIPMETRTAGLYPAAPMGANIVSRISSGPVRLGVQFTIGLNFHEE